MEMYCKSESSSGELATLISGTGTDVDSFSDVFRIGVLGCDSSMSLREVRSASVPLSKSLAARSSPRVSV